MVPFRDKVVLVAKNRLYRRTAVGYSAISGSLVSRISLISFSFGFQLSSSRGSSTPGNSRRPATEVVLGTYLASVFR
jgi:hypothetical protein